MKVVFFLYFLGFGGGAGEEGRVQRFKKTALIVLLSRTLSFCLCPVSRCLAPRSPHWVTNSVRLLGSDPFSLFRNAKPTTAATAQGKALALCPAPTVCRAAHAGAQGPEVGPEETRGPTSHRSHVASAALKLGSRATTPPGAAAQLPKLGLDLGANATGRAWN